MIDIFGRSFLVDTNILVYSLDKKSPFHKSVAELFRLCEQKRIRLFVTHQNFLELVNTLVSDYGFVTSKAVESARVLLYEGSLYLIHPLPTTLNLCFDLLQSRIKRNVFDVYLAVTAIDNGVNSILTNNAEDFVGIPQLNVYGLSDISRVTRE